MTEFRITDEQRYENAAHAMQSGVKMEIEFEATIWSPEDALKDLRVGVNAALVDSAGFAKLLIAKGIITKEEYTKAIADEMELEVKRYEERLSVKMGTKIKLV